MIPFFESSETLDNNAAVKYKYINTLLHVVVVIQSAFPLLRLDSYLILLILLNRYIYPDIVKEISLLPSAASGNVSVVRYEVSLVTIPLLDFVLVH